MYHYFLADNKPLYCVLCTRRYRLKTNYKQHLIYDHGLSATDVNALGER